MGKGRTVGNARSLPAVLIMAMLMLAGLAACEMAQVTRGSMERLEGGMPATGNGTALRIEHAFEGTTSLVWGHEGSDDLRIVDDNLTTLGVLPQAGPWSIKGASISEGGVRAFVWGPQARTGPDSIAIYNLTDYSVEQDYIPPGLIDMARIDYVRSMAWGLILVVAGRSTNGTSELLFIETVPMQVLKRHPLPGNASVQYIGTDGISMVCLLEDGHLVVVSTRDWTIAHTVDALDGPASAWSLGQGKWLLGGADGTVIVWDEHYRKLDAEMHTDGPVQGVARTVDGFNVTLIVASPGPEGGSILRAFRMWNVSDWRLATEEPWPVAVSMLGTHPTRGDAVLVCGADGSVQPLEVRTWSDYVQGMRVRPFLIGGTVVLILAVAGSVLWSRRKHSHG